MLGGSRTETKCPSCMSWAPQGMPGINTSTPSAPSIPLPIEQPPTGPSQMQPAILARQPRKTQFGRFSISEIHRKGVLVGWGATCKAHHNVSNCYECKKQLADSHFTPDELRLAVKRWLVLGLEIPDVGEAQAFHVRYANTAALVATGPSEEECDKRLHASLPQPSS